MPKAPIAIASPNMSYSAVVETAPAADGTHRSLANVEYGTAHSDRRALGLGRCERGWKG